jgi:signal transduction histidine kinase
MRVLPRLDEWWLPPRPSPEGLRRDVLLAAALLVAGLATVELMRATPMGEGINDGPVESLVWSAAITAPLALRRIFPVAVMVVCSTVFYVVGDRLPVTASSVVVQVALFMAIYAAWAWSRHPVRLLTCSTLVILGMFLWLAELIARNPAPPNAPGIVPASVAVAVVTLAINVVYFFGAVGWGYGARRAAQRRALLVEQTLALRREQEITSRRAVAEDRLRIARDLHDAVAHHVTGIGVQAAAARHVLDRDPAGSRAALAAIEGSSRSAVHEMHQIVGLLRRDDDAPSLRPDLGSLPELAREAERATAGRLTVRCRRVGEPFDVPDPVQTSLFRTAQEALTNVRRHSTAREAQMVLRYVETDPRAIEVEVLDSGPPTGAPSDGPGFGLQGLRERAAVHGATVDIGRRPEGGFRVRVRFPVPEVAR